MGLRRFSISRNISWTFRDFFVRTQGTASKSWNEKECWRKCKKEDISGVRKVKKLKIQRKKFIQRKKLGYSKNWLYLKTLNVSVIFLFCQLVTFELSNERWLHFLVMNIAVTATCDAYSVIIFDFNWANYHEGVGSDAILENQLHSKQPFGVQRSWTCSTR